MGRKRIYLEKEIFEEILSKVKIGQNIEKACSDVGISRCKLYKLATLEQKYLLKEAKCILTKIRPSGISFNKKLDDLFRNPNII